MNSGHAALPTSLGLFAMLGCLPSLVPACGGGDSSSAAGPTGSTSSSATATLAPGHRQ